MLHPCCRPSHSPCHVSALGSFLRSSSHSWTFLLEETWSMDDVLRNGVALRTPSLDGAWTDSKSVFVTLEGILPMPATSEGCCGIFFSSETTVGRSFAGCGCCCRCCCCVCVCFFSRVFWTKQVELLAMFKFCRTRTCVAHACGFSASSAVDHIKSNQIKSQRRERRSCWDYGLDWNGKSSVINGRPLVATTLSQRSHLPNEAPIRSSQRTKSIREGRSDR